MGMGSEFDLSGLNGLVWDDASQSFVLDPAVGQAPAQAAPQAPQNDYVGDTSEGGANYGQEVRGDMGDAYQPINNSSNPNFNSGSAATPEWMQGSIPQWNGGQSASPPNLPATQPPSASGGGSSDLDTFYRRLVSDRAQGRTDPAGYDWKTDATVPDYAIPKGYSRIPPAGTTTGGTSNPQAPYQPPQGRQAPPQMYTPPQWNNTVVPMGAGIPQTGLNGANGHFGRQAEMVDLAAGLRNIAANSQGS